MKNQLMYLFGTEIQRERTLKGRSRHAGGKMNFTQEEIEQNRKDWIAALRSGEFKQQRDCLLETKNGFCCLGVGCRVVLRNHPDCMVVVEDSENKYGPIKFDSEMASLPPTAMAALGMRSEWGRFEGGRLHAMNDRDKTFAEIADIIESRPQGLFVEDSK